MRLRHQNPEPKISKPARPKPVSEGIFLCVPKNSKGERSWQSMSDSELLSYSQELIDRIGIQKPNEFRKNDGCLAYALDKRGLFGNLVFRTRKRFWGNTSDEELIALAQRIIDEKRLLRPKELQGVDNGLMQAIWKRGLGQSLVFAEERRTIRDWSSMSDDGLVAHAQGLLDERGVKRRSDLEQEDYGLYQVLCKRRLMDCLKFQEEGFRWSKMSDSELVEHAQRIVDGEGIENRHGLELKYSGLYGTLVRRNVIGKLRLKRVKENRWAAMGDGELLGFAQGYVDKNGILNKKQLVQAESGLVRALTNRGLWASLRLRDAKCIWKERSDDEIVEMAGKIVVEGGIANMAQLKKINSPLHSALQARKLSRRVPFTNPRVVKRCAKAYRWKEISGDDLLERARNLVESNGIRGRKEFVGRFGGLFNALKRRGLLEELGLESKNANFRNWSEMSIDEIVAYAQRVVDEKGIKGRKHLCDEDPSMGAVLRKRRLMGRIKFEISLMDWNSMSNDEIVEFARQWVAENGITRRVELERRNGPLNHALRKRKLMDLVIKNKRQTEDWASKSDAELLDFARRHLEDNGIKGRKGLEDSYKRLYDVLRRRGLIDAAFSGLERLGHMEAVEGVLDALDSFGDEK